jgi:hypothetical protein
VVYLGNSLSHVDLKFGCMKQLRSECAEIVKGVDGMALLVGNCLGGATTINLGLYSEETPKWIVEHMGEGFGTEAEVLEAYEWVSKTA